MGNHLKRIALYCDCLEKPWQPYQVEQSEQSSKSSQKQSHFEEKQQNKHVIFDQPQDRMVDHNPPLLFSLTKEIATNDDLDELSNETDIYANGKKIDDMEIIDLQKIDPNIINKEAKLLNLHKKSHPHSKKPTQQKLPPLNSLITTIKPQLEQSQDTLSNMFQNEANESQTKNKYFVDGEQQVYQWQQGAQKDHKESSKKSQSVARNAKY